MILTRRNFITGATAFLATPAIVRVTSLMPIKAQPPIGMSANLRPGAVNYVPTDERVMWITDWGKSGIREIHYSA